MYDSIYVRQVKGMLYMRFYLESFGKVNLNHPLWAECKELEAIKNMSVGQWGHYLFRKNVCLKYIRVRRCE